MWILYVGLCQGPLLIWVNDDGGQFMPESMKYFFLIIQGVSEKAMSNHEVNIFGALV